MKTRLNIFRIAPCLLAIIVDFFSFGLVYPIVTAIFTDKNDIVFAVHGSVELKYFFLGLSYLLYPLFMFIGASFLGDLSDRFGRKAVLLICMAGICVSFVLMAIGIILKSILIFLFGRAASGLMAGSQPVSQAAIADLSTPENKATNMAVITFTICIGIVIGPVIGGIFSDAHLMSQFKLYTPFLVAAALAFIAFLGIALVFKETYVVKIRNKIDWTRPARLFVEAAHDKVVRKLLLVLVLMQVGFGLYFQMILVLLSTKFHYSSLDLGMFYAYLGVFFAIGLIVIIKYALKKWGVESVGFYAILIMGIMQVLSSFPEHQIIIWIIVVPLGISNVVGYTAIITKFSDAVDKERQGWVMGILAAGVALSWVITGLTTNFLSFISVNLILLIGGILSIISSLAFYYLYKINKANN